METFTSELSGIHDISAVVESSQVRDELRFFSV